MNSILKIPTHVNGIPLISRKEAKALKYKRYFTGTPCLRGHIAEHYTGSGVCIKCDAIGVQKRYELYTKVRTTDEVSIPIEAMDAPEAKRYCNKFSAADSFDASVLWTKAHNNIRRREYGTNREDN